jgi:phage tail-like protein
MPGRGLTPGAVTPHPLADLLPALFQEDGFSVRLCAALDDVVVPALVALDCLDAYLDPALTPPDFLDWLAGWVGLSLDQNWSEAQRRALVSRAGELYRWQGTIRGLVEHLRLYAGVEPEVSDSGGAAWSARAGGALPGTAVPEVRVRVVVARSSPVDERQLEAVVKACKPAHVRHRVEVIRSDR